ncbi:MAG TPA: F0F1 ATP synthase subunit B [Victivallales bacterium]|nr:F0F1 ATP synthase subunit B [Victivallales bacterium]
MQANDTISSLSVAEHAPVEARDHGAGGSGIFSMDPGLVIWTWIVFGLLFLVLSKFAWKPMMESVRRREQTLKDAVENARKTKEELDRISIRQEEMIKLAEENSRKIIDEARKKAEDVSRSIVDRANQDAEKAMLKIKEEIILEREKTMNEIKRSAVDMVIAASGKILERDLDDNAHREFIKRQLDKR